LVLGHARRYALHRHPSGCSLKLDRRLKLDVVELVVPELGTLSGRIGDACISARAEDFSANAA